jgi:serine/threonine protein kinase
LIGKTLGQYEVVSALGQGGMGEVYRARDTQLDREVAIKVLPREMSGDPERIARFRREARTLATLQHPNVATIYGFEDTPEARFLVMELVEGEDLSERIGRGPMPVDEVIDISRQIAAGLEAAHENSVMHRDLKPANVKLTPDGNAKILDFGLARAWLGDAEEQVDPAHSPTITAAMTQAGTILGTAAYMSPEQARGKRVDRRADIWAFGVIVVEMLRGQSLFPGETVSDTLASVLKTDIDLSTLPKNTPLGLKRLIQRCLDRNPANRLRDIGEARIALEGPLDDAPASASVRTTHRGRLFLLGALAGMILGAAAITVFGGGSSAPESSRQIRFSIPRVSTTETPRSEIAPDGSRLLYVDDGQLWIREFDQPVSRPIPGTEDAIVCDWSPDGRWIVWATATTIYKALSDGSNRTRLCEIDTGLHSWAGGLAWTDEGLILLAPGDTGIQAVGESGGDPFDYVPLTEQDTDFHHVDVLPGGHGVIFHPHIDLAFNSIDLVSDSGRKQLLEAEGQELNSATYAADHIIFHRTPQNAGIWAVPFSLEAEKTTGEPFMAVPDAMFPSVSDSGDLVYVPDEAERFQVVRLDRSGNVIARIGDEIDGATDLALSPDESEAAYVVGGQKYELWIVDLESGQRQRFAEEEKLIRSPGWSADGSSLVYSVGAYGTGGHQKIRNRGGGKTTIIDVRGASPQLTADNRFLVLTFYDEHADPGIGYIDLEDPSQTLTPLVDSTFEEEGPALSPDGTLIAYESMETGRREVFLTTFPDGERQWQISDDGGSQPHWSTDGSEIVFRSAGFTEKFVVNLTREPIRLTAPRPLLRTDEIGWLNSTSEGSFYALERMSGVSQSSFEVWLGWADTLQR